jgi:hypothetical protein
VHRTRGLKEESAAITNHKAAVSFFSKKNEFGESGRRFFIL